MKTVKNAEKDFFVLFNPVTKKCLGVNDEMQIAPHNRTLGAKKKRERALVMFGGPLFNFLLAIVVYFIVGYALDLLI